MDSPDKRAGRRLAEHRLAVQRRRLSLLRSRVFVTAIATFVLLWCVVFVQLVSGNDPVLGATSSAAARGGQTAVAREPEAEARTEGEAQAEAEALAEAEGQAEAEAQREAEAAEAEAEAIELEAVTSGQS